MKWLTSNLLILLVLGLLLFLGSFLRGRVWVVKPNWLAFGIGSMLLVALVIGVIQVVRGPPGQVDTVEEKPSDKVPVVPKSALVRLRNAWDADAAADWPASETLADISEIAYQSPHDAEKSYRRLGFSTVMPVVQGSMIGYVITGEDVTVVVFRGTDFTEVSDWLANLGRSATDTPHGQVHKGFYDAYQSMKSQVDAILKERNTKHLWVTGHSLGGALALVCAYDLIEVEKQQLDGVITFGQPMVARQKFADYIDNVLVGRYARFVNRDDIVPKVPPSHVACGSLVWFTDEGLRRSKVKHIVYGATKAPPDPPVGELSDEAEVKPLSEAEFKALQAKLKAENAEKERLPEGTPMKYQAAASPIDDHSMWLYLEKIRKLLGIKNSIE
jgi:Predicted lipase